MKTNSREKRLEKLLLPAFGVYVAALLWVTLLSRIGSDTRHIYPPLWSYKAIAVGDLSALWDDICNVLLFIPFGFCISYFTGLKKQYVVLTGLVISVLIECSQWWFKLGSVELDDVINNTIGTALGVVAVEGKNKVRKRGFVAECLIILALVGIPAIIQLNRNCHMRKMANLFDERNLLVLNGNPGYVGDSEVYVSYDDDSLKIEGNSDVVGYKRIGRLKLGAGEYSFSGFSGTEPSTIGIYLEKYDPERDGYYRFTSDLGPRDSDSFSFTRDEKVRVYVKVYPGAEGEYAARPVIYREG